MTINSAIDKWVKDIPIINWKNNPDAKYKALKFAIKQEIEKEIDKRINKRAMPYTSKSNSNLIALRDCLTKSLGSEKDSSDTLCMAQSTRALESKNQSEKPEPKALEDDGE